MRLCLMRLYAIHPAMKHLALAANWQGNSVNGRKVAFGENDPPNGIGVVHFTDTPYFDRDPCADPRAFDTLRRHRRSPRRDGGTLRGVDPRSRTQSSAKAARPVRWCSRRN